MIESQEFRLTDRPMRPLGQVPWYRRFGKQIVFSVFASMIGGAIVNGTSLAVGVQYASAIVVRTFGDPFARGREVAKEAKEKVQQTVGHTPAVPVPVNPLGQPPGGMVDLLKHREEAWWPQSIA